MSDKLELQQIISEIDEKIKIAELRIKAGDVILRQCKDQMRILKNKIKEYKKIKETVIVKSYAADGDL